MIRPTKYLDLNTCVIRVAAEMLALLKGAEAIKYAELLGRLQIELSDTVQFEFVAALDLLYLLGKVEYHADSDSIVLTSKMSEGHSL